MTHWTGIFLKNSREASDTLTVNFNHRFINNLSVLLFLESECIEDIEIPPKPFQNKATLTRKAVLVTSCLMLTSSAAFWTVTWLKTRAPSSGQTVFSSSLLREKSWAPVRTPRLVMVLQRRRDTVRPDTAGHSRTGRQWFTCSAEMMSINRTLTSFSQ